MNKRPRYIDWSEMPVVRSKRLERDPRIEDVEYADTSASDYRYLVTLKRGWIFDGYGCRTKGFNLVRDCLRYIVAGEPS